MFASLIYEHFLILKLHARTSKAVVIAIVVATISFQAQPTKFMLAFFAINVIATLVFFNRRLAVGALPKYLEQYLILRVL